MKMVTKLISPALLALAFLATPETGETGVTMTGMIQSTGDFGLDILPTATFTVDDWLSNPNLWWLTIINTDDLAVVEAKIYINIYSTKYNKIIGSEDINSKDACYIDLINAAGGDAYRKVPLKAGDAPITIYNTIITGKYVYAGNWNKVFRDEVLRIGYLPEDTYTLKFELWVRYENEQKGVLKKVDEVTGEIDIKNPLPPELVTPDNGADNVVTVPRFAWQAPVVSNLRTLGKIRVKYIVTLWKMFNENGATLTSEEAIRRIPIWKDTIEDKLGRTDTSIEFRPGTAREELIPGRKYCWQVQAFDGTGRYISAQNEGKSDIWEFSVKFTPAVINEPIFFFPLRFTWTGAQAGGGVVRYDVAVSENQDFSRAYEVKGQIMASFSYPSDAPVLSPGKLYYIRIQAVDDKGIPIGSPTIGSFTIPTAEVSLVAPEDNAAVATLTPVFRWQGTARSYVVTVFQEGSRWSVSSGKVDVTSWTYDGEDLKRGATYSWQVAPSDERGEPAGPPTAARRFTVPEETQITLSSPVNAVIETVFPTFAWNGLPRSDSQVSYVIEITTESGSAVHSTTVTTTSYPYPQFAPALAYGTKYLWRVRAQRGGSDIGSPSTQAWFVTPFVQAGGGEPTLAEIGSAVKQVLADYPQFAPFKDMTLTGMIDQSGPLSPSRFLELLDKYRIKSVTTK